MPRYNCTVCEREHQTTAQTAARLEISINSLIRDALALRYSFWLNRLEVPQPARYEKGGYSYGVWLGPRHYTALSVLAKAHGLNLCDQLRDAVESYKDMWCMAQAGGIKIGSTVIVVPAFEAALITPTSG